MGWSSKWWTKIYVGTCWNQVAFDFFRWKISLGNHGFLPIKNPHVLWQKITTSPLSSSKEIATIFKIFQRLGTPTEVQKFPGNIRRRLDEPTLSQLGVVGCCFSLSGVYQKKNTGEVPEVIWFAYEIWGMRGPMKSQEYGFHQKLIQGPNPNGPRDQVSCDRAIRYSGLGVRSFVGPVGDFWFLGMLRGFNECKQNSWV